MLRELINDAETKATPAIVRVPIERVLDNPYQPRQTYNPNTLIELATNIAGMKLQLPLTSGLQQPPAARVVRLNGAGIAEPLVVAASLDTAMRRDQSIHVQLLFGHRRLRAFRLLALGPESMGLDVDMGVAGLRFEPDPDYATFPIMVVAATNAELWSHAIAENSQREDISAIEEAQLLQRAIDEFGLTAEQAGQPFGWSRSTVANKLRLLKLPEKVQTAVIEGALTERHARELLRLADAPERLAEQAQKAIEKSYTVRELTINVDQAVRDHEQDVQVTAEIAAAREVLARGWTPPGSTEPLPADREILQNDWHAHEFNYSTAHNDRIILHSGLCNGTDCPCMVLCHVRHVWPGSIQIAPEEAPHIVLACKDYERLRKRREAAYGQSEEPLAPDTAAKLQEMMKHEEQEREAEAAQAKSLHAAAEQLWQQALDTKALNTRELWNSLRFWQFVMKTVPYSVQDAVRQGMSLEGVCQKLLHMLYRDRCTTWVGPGGRLADPDRVRQLVVDLTGKELEVATPVINDKAEAARAKLSSTWPTDWDNADETCYQDIMAEFDSWHTVTHLIGDDVTPRVLLRLIDACPEKRVRGQLWYRYNQTVSRETVKENQA